MKKGSLYEVLKSASRPGGDDVAGAGEAPPVLNPDGAQLTLQERLSAYKAAKLAEAQLPSTPSAPAATLVLEPDPVPPVAVAEPPPPAAPPVRVEPPAPVRVEIAPPSEEPAPPPVVKGPGERMLRVTYNTAAFAGLVVLALVFAAYAVGLRTGRVEAAAVPAPRSDVRSAPLPAEPVRPPPPPAPAIRYTIRLAEWKLSTSRERLEANRLSEELRKSLERAGYRGVEVAKIKRNGEDRLALFWGTFPDVVSDPVRSKLAALRGFKSGASTPFAQAVFEELPPAR